MVGFKVLKWDTDTTPKVSWKLMSIMWNMDDILHLSLLLPQRVTMGFPCSEKKKPIVSDGLHAFLSSIESSFSTLPKMVGCCAVNVLVTRALFMEIVMSLFYRFCLTRASLQHQASRFSNQMTDLAGTSCSLMAFSIHTMLYQVSNLYPQAWNSPTIL